MLFGLLHRESGGNQPLGQLRVKKLAECWNFGFDGVAQIPTLSKWFHSNRWSTHRKRIRHLLVHRLEGGTLNEYMVPHV